MSRKHSGTIKFKTTFGSMFLHVETDIPCRVLGFAVATPQTLENSTLGKFIEQLKYDEDEAEFADIIRQLEGQ
jgi:hypothetical protein